MEHKRDMMLVEKFYYGYLILLGVLDIVAAIPLIMVGVMFGESTWLYALVVFVPFFGIVLGKGLGIVKIPMGILCGQLGVALLSGAHPYLMVISSIVYMVLVWRLYKYFKTEVIPYYSWENRKKSSGEDIYASWKKETFEDD